MDTDILANLPSDDDTDDGTDVEGGEEDAEGVTDSDAGEAEKESGSGEDDAEGEMDLQGEGQEDRRTDDEDGAAERKTRGEMAIDVKGTPAAETARGDGPEDVLVDGEGESADIDGKLPRGEEDAHIALSPRIDEISPDADDEFAESFLRSTAMDVEHQIPLGAISPPIDESSPDADDRFAESFLRSAEMDVENGSGRMDVD